MPADYSPFDIADVALLAAGTLILVGWAIQLSVRRRWRDQFNLPPPPPNRLEPADLLIGLVTFIFLPAVLARVFSPETSQDSSAGAGTTTFGRVLTLTVSQFIAIIVLLAIGRERFADGLRGWGLTASAWRRRMLQASIGFLAACPICYGLLKLSELVLDRLHVEYPQHEAIKALMDSTTPMGLRIVVVLNAFLLASVAEELLFRGLLQSALIRWGRSSWSAIIVSSVLWALIHYPYTDTIAPLAAFGVILGYLYARTGSLVLVILTHAIFNGKTLLWLVLGAK